jgi:uncharacterized repeat protein (TIGR01451 family)
LNYDVGGTAQTLIESAPGGNSTAGAGAGVSTDFLEDRLVNFTVAEVGGITTTVTPSAVLQVQEFLVTNNGNGTQDFLFAALDNANGTANPVGAGVDSFNVVSSQVFVETVNAGFDATDDTAIFADQVAPLGTVTVYIVSTMPADTLPLANGDIAVMTLVAQVADGSAVAADTAVAANAGVAIVDDSNGFASPAGTYNNGVTPVVGGTGAGDTADSAIVEDVVFNDAIGTLDSEGNADAARNGQHSADDSYTVATAELTVSKTSVVLWDPINNAANPKAIPGAYVTYTVTVTNAGTATASADLTTLSDTLQAAGVGFGAADLDPDFVTNVGPGNPTNAVGDAFEVDTTGTARGVPGLSYCTGDIGDADVDGCSYTGGASGTLSIVYGDPATPANPNLAAMAVEAGYTEGELKPGESVVVRFNVIVQ